MPVYRDAKLGLKTMQPIVFSHGLSGHRMVYSALYRELASCGYCVIALTHSDGSADYSATAGLFDNSFEIYDYAKRNICVKIRENELNAVVKEITEVSTLD